MKIVLSVLAVTLLALSNLSALEKKEQEPAENEIVLTVHFDKADLKSKDPYPIVANLIVYRNFDAVLWYGGGAMSEFKHTLSAEEARDLKSLVGKYAAYRKEENKDEKVHLFSGSGKTPVEKEGLTELEALGLEITTKIIKGIK